LGFAVTIVGTTLAFYILVRKLFQPEHYAAGWVSLSSLIVILGGLNLTLIGMVGSWLARTYEQVKGRPRFIVMEAVDQTDSPTLVKRDEQVPLAG
jgi:dolichol-phosphate mannosyltransferase